MWLQLLPLLLRSPVGEQLEALPAVKTSQHFVACEVGPHFTNKDLSRWLNKFVLHWGPHINFRKVFKLTEVSGSSRRQSGVPQRLWASTVHCSRSAKLSLAKNLIKLGASPSCCGGDSRNGEGFGGDGEGDFGFSAVGTTWISNGICTGWGATTLTNYSCRPISISLSDISPWKSWCSIVQQENFRLWTYDPRFSSRLLFFMLTLRHFFYPFYTYSTPHFSSSGPPWTNFLFSYSSLLSTPNAYLNHRTPISAPEGRTTINVAEQRLWKRLINEKHWLDQWFFKLIFKFLLKFSPKKLKKHC